MKNILVILAATVTLAACSSSTTTSDPSPIAPAVKKEKAVAPSSPVQAGKPYSPPKPMKCKFDTDCVVLDSCSGGKCKITGAECRFRSDCQGPRGTCVSDKCNFQ